MRLSLDYSETTNMIQSYQPGVITVAQQKLTASSIISAADVSPWTPQRFEDLAPEHFQMLAEREPEMVILGTGARQQFPSAEVLRPLLERGIGVEVMDTGAACRTYNIVVAEGRRVIMAILMI